MKARKILGLITAMITLVGCGGKGGSAAPSWSADEKKAINDYLYGINLPYFNVNGSSELHYDEDYGYVVKEGGTISFTELTKIVQSFPSEWGLEQYVYDETGYNDYYGTFEVETEQGTRYIYMDIGAYDEDGYNVEEGEEGTFMFYAYDPYYYEWPEEVIEYLNSYLVDDPVSVIPELVAPMYELYTAYVSWGMYMIYCYDLEATAVEAYADTCEAADWKCVGEDSYGYYNYVTAENDILINFGYDEDYECVEIYVAASDYVDVADVSFAATSKKILVGGSATLTAIAYDENEEVIEDFEGFTWSMKAGSDADITVDQTGKVSVASTATVGDVGTVVVTATNLNGDEFTDECTITAVDESKLDKYVKVTSSSQIVAGSTYLIVYEGEEEALVMDGTLCEDTSGNFVSTTITGGFIINDGSLDGMAFTLEEATGGYALKNESGYYIGSTSNSNKTVYQKTALVNTVVVESTGVKITSSTSSCVLRYNSNNGLFRFYKASTYTNQEPIQLYVLSK